jgi:hypothetical protein
MYWYIGVVKKPKVVVHYDNDFVVLTVVEVVIFMAIFHGEGVDLSLGCDRIDALILVNKYKYIFLSFRPYKSYFTV